MRGPYFLVLFVGIATVTAGCISDSPSDAGGGDSDAARAALLAAYDFKPFSTDTPEHSWFKLDGTHLQFIHWNHADPAKATGPLFAGDGVKARFCFGEGGISRSDYDAGFVHFHSAVAPNWDAGHNNAGVYDPSVEGWWLRHIGAIDGTMHMMGMSMPIEKGKVFPLMPADATKVAACAA